MTEFSRDEFVKKIGGLSLDQLRKDALSGYGHELRARTKAVAVDECWELYSGAIKPQGRAGAPVPEVAPELAPEVTGLVYEARIRGHRADGYGRAGYRLKRRWEDLTPPPSAEQLEAMRADPNVQVRIKE